MIADDQVTGLECNREYVALRQGTAKNFFSNREPGKYLSGPLMVDAWSQTTGSDFSILYDIKIKEQQSQREKEQEYKIKILEESLRAHSELLSEIQAATARTTVLLGQHQQTAIQSSDPHSNNGPSNNVIINNNATNSFNNSNSTVTTQFSPKIVNTFNKAQQINSSSAESVKYKIIAEGAGNNNEEPIEIELAEEDGALNLNNSADSGRLEICLAPEENVEVKTEFNTSYNNMIIEHHQPTDTSGPTTSTQCHFIKKRKLSGEQNGVLTTKSEYANEQPVTPVNDVIQNPSYYERHSVGRFIKTPTMQNNKNINESMDIPTTPNQNNDKFMQQIEVDNDLAKVMISIGPNNTRVAAKIYNSINWTSASIATRKLLMALFDRKVLATHSMTGKPSPAFKGYSKPIKQMLDPKVVSDIIFVVTRNCNVSDKEVRCAITTKCADENKMMKINMKKENSAREMNKENLEGDFKNRIKRSY